MKDTSRGLPAATAAGDSTAVLSKCSSFNDSSASHAFSQYQNHLFHAGPASDGDSPVATDPPSPTTPSDPSPHPSASPGTATTSASAGLSATAAAAAEASRKTLARCRATSGPIDNSCALPLAPINPGSSVAGASVDGSSTTGAAAPAAAGASRSLLGPGASCGMHAPGGPGESGHNVRVRPVLDTSVDNLSRRGYMLHQLDAFGAGAGLLGEYYMADASPDNRFVGGGAIVQIVRHNRSHEEFALKAFAAHSAFHAEAALYAASDSALGVFLPRMRLLLDNLNGSFRDPHGHKMPPCIIMEKGESVDLWRGRVKPSTQEVIVVRSETRQM